MNTNLHSLIDKLGLKPHPEGGYYREIYRSKQLVQPSDKRTDRSALTVIYFLLLAGQCSRWHRVLSDEVWCHLEGDPLELICCNESNVITTITLGRCYPEHQEPVHVVPANEWQAARPLGEYSLVSCAVGPGFDFVDFSLAADVPTIAEVIAQHTEYSALL